MNSSHKAENHNYDPTKVHYFSHVKIFTPLNDDGGESDGTSIILFTFVLLLRLILQKQGLCRKHKTYEFT